MKPKTLALSFIILLAVAAASCRIMARKAALEYGHKFMQAVSAVGVEGFANTPKLREFLASSEMTGPLDRIHILSFLGGGYGNRADELQRGMLYLSGQMALQPEQRFAAPPTFGLLTLSAADHTDGGIAASAKNLIAMYMAQL